MIPPAIALFSAILKKKGHKIEIFDTTYYQVDSGTNYDKAMEKQLAVLPSNMESRGIKMKTPSWKDDIKKRIIHFKPDLIAISATEDMWELGVKLLCEIKDYKIKNNVPVIAGGVFPTFAPEIVSKEELVDLLCIGEGENTLVDICDKIQNKKDYSDVTNIWVRSTNCKRNLYSRSNYKSIFRLSNLDSVFKRFCNASRLFNYKIWLEVLVIR